MQRLALVFAVVTGSACASEPLRELPASHPASPAAKEAPFRAASDTLDPGPIPESVPDASNQDDPAPGAPHGHHR
jgi:hypothetical protein